MYLSRLALDGARGDTMRLLASPYRLHGVVESCFGGEKGRNLWRVDYLDGAPYLLILSETKPDFGALASRYGRSELSSVCESKAYEPLLARVALGQRWQFRLRGNPVRSNPREPGKGGRGRLYNHVTQEQQKAWLTARGAVNGFALEDDWFQVVHSKWYQFRKGERGIGEVSLLAVTFEGTLSVTDPVLFRNALEHGIGRVKAYGCGLLTIARMGG